jgi:hypothetical protein
VPIERFQRAEAKALKPVAGIPPFHVARELIRRVQADCAVEIDGNAYSVPWRLIGETVRATLMGGVVRIHHGSQEVAVHLACAGHRQRAVDPAHFEELAGFRSIRARAGDPPPPTISSASPRSWPRRDESVWSVENGTTAGRKTPQSGATKLVMLRATSPPSPNPPSRSGFSAAC